MRFRPARIVRVTHESELDAALASADQIVVEGDDRLLTLAVSRATGDPGNRIDLDLNGDMLYGTGDAGDLFGDAKAAAFTFDGKKAAWRRPLLWAGIVLLLLALAGAASVLPSLAWPAMAIVAGVALFFIARQAIARGRNVDIRWKSERFAGRVVITKVRAPVWRVRAPV
jgi:hypothetical protein